MGVYSLGNETLNLNRSVSIMNYSKIENTENMQHNLSMSRT